MQSRGCWVGMPVSFGVNLLSVVDRLGPFLFFLPILVNIVFYASNIFDFFF